MNSKEKDIFRIRKEAWESIVGENSNKWANAYSMIKEGLKQYPDSWILKDSLVHFLAVLAMPKHNEDYLSASKELNIPNKAAVHQLLCLNCPESEYHG